MWPQYDTVPVAVAAAVLAGACSVVAPPPAAPVLATPAPEERDTVTLSVAVGLSGGAFTDSAIGGELRVEWQDRTRRAYGIALVGGYNFDVHRDCDGSYRPPPEIVTARNMFDVRPHCSSAWLVALRGYRVYHAASAIDHIATHVGAGLGYAEGGLLYATGDAGVRIGSAEGGVDAYAVPQLALSVPILRGRPIENGERPALTVYLGSEFGIVFADNRASGAALSGTFLIGHATNGEGVLHMGAAAGGHTRRDD